MILKVTVQNSIEVFYYVRDDKDAIHATCLFQDRLFVNLEESSEIEVEVEEYKYQARFSIVEPSDEKLKIIARIRQRYDWNDQEQRKNIGLDPRVFVIELIDVGAVAK